MFKLFKKISVVTSIAFVISMMCSILASAEVEVKSLSLEERYYKPGYTLLNVEEYFENGYKIIDRLYVEDSDLVPMATSGSRWVTHEKDIAADGGDFELLYTFYAKGYFTWNLSADTVTVSNPSGGYTSYVTNYPIVVDDDCVSASNQGNTFLAGNKYAYVRYYLTLQNQFGSRSTYEVYVDVNVRGISSKA